MWDSLAGLQVANQDLRRVVVFFAVVLFSLVVGRLARFAVNHARGRAERAAKEWLAVLLGALAKPMVLVAVAAGLSLWAHTDAVLSLPEGWASAFLAGCGVLSAVAAGYLVYSLVDVVDHYLVRLAARTESRVDDVLAPLLGKTVRITILVLVVLNVAHVVSGKNITTILAGLGFGGLAIALAGQDTIKNFFGSVIILGDRPFEIGDRIVIDGHDGPVESVGFRSTKIRTLDGHLVTVPNSEMVSRSVQNIGKRPYIKRVARITITYDTPPGKVEEACNILAGILENHEGMDPEFPPRVYFEDFQDCALSIMMIYWYHPPDYWAYMEFSNRVNMAILERFNEAGIEFAFPTRTVYLANDERRQVALRVLKEQT